MEYRTVFLMVCVILTILGHGISGDDVEEISKSHLLERLRATLEHSIRVRRYLRKRENDRGYEVHHRQRSSNRYIVNVQNLQDMASSSGTCSEYMQQKECLCKQPAKYDVIMYLKLEIHNNHDVII